MRTLGIFAAVALAAAAARPDPLPLAGASVVLPAAPTPAEQRAAAELADVLGQIDGHPHPVATNTPPPGVAILLRPDAALGPEQYRLRAEAGRLVIAGGRPRGLLYGVYGLLADHLGCRWYTRDVARIPRQADPGVPADLDEISAPRFEYREVYWSEAQDGDWAARNRINSSHARLEERHGGRVRYGPFVHTFDKILPVAKYYESHPEYYSLIGGRRLRERPQLCLSNPEVLALTIETVRRWIAEQPEARIFSVSQNDWGHPCECPACKAIDDAEGSHAGSLLTFVNAVADAIAAEHPGVAIDTLAYQYTRKPPRTIRPRPNVIVRLCSIECCFAHPLAACPEPSNRSFVEDLAGWSRLTQRLYVWDYTTDFAHYLLPFPNLRSLDENLRTFAGNGVAGVFEQGACTRGGGAELADLRSWLLAQLLWDPRRDGAALAREFVAGVYGPAAPAVQRYLDLREAARARAGNHVRIYAGPQRPDLLPADLAAWDAALAEADRAAAGDDALRSRVRRLRMPVWYAQFARGDAAPEVLRASATNLAAAAVAEGLTDFREDSRGLAFELRALERDRFRRTPPAAPPGVVMIEDSRFHLHRPGDLTDRVADEAAGDGVAARLAGRTTEWAVAWTHHGDPDVPPGRYRIAPLLRVERTATNGAALHAGAYDETSRKSLAEQRVQAADAPAAYAALPAFEAELRDGVTVYVAPDDNPGAIANIFIDALRLEGPLP